VEFAGGGRAGEGTPMRRVRSLDLFSGREREGADIPDDEARVASDLIESYGEIVGACGAEFEGIT